MILGRTQRKVLQYARAHGLLPDGSLVLVGLSGGPDSVALLRLLHALNAAGAISATLRAVHLNHGIRGAEADADEKFCNRLAKKLRVPIVVKRENVPAFAGSRGLSLEEAARRVRYEVFRKAALSLARKSPRARVVIALGHHADDQAETVLQRIIRGTGIAGLAGIPAKRPLPLGGGKSATIARPLLALRRSEIAAYLAEIGQPYQVDESNLGAKFMRGRLRNELLPLLREKYNPAVDEALLRLAGIARQWLDAARNGAAEYTEGADAWEDTGTLTIPLAALKSGQPAKTQLALRRIMQNAGVPLKKIGRGHYTALLQLALGMTGGQAHLPGLVAIREKNALRLQKEMPTPPAPSPRTASLPVGGAAKFPGGTITCRETRRSFKPGRRDGLSEMIDLDSVALPLSVRFPKPGDAFRPLGAPGEKKALKFLAERNVPARRRMTVPLVVDGKGIIWAVGHRIADRVKITRATKRTLLLKFSGRTKCPSGVV